MPRINSLIRHCLISFVTKPSREMTSTMMSAIMHVISDVGGTVV